MSLQFEWHAVSESDPLQWREDGAPLVQDDVRVEIIDSGDDAIAQPLLVADRRLSLVRLR